MLFLTRRRLTLLVILAGVCALLAVAAASSRLTPGAEGSPTQWTVENADNAGPGSLRDTIAAAGPGDSIVFAPGLAGATIELTSGELLIDKNLTITGPNPPVTVDGNVDQVFRVGGSAIGVDLIRVSVTGGDDAHGGGIRVFGGAHLTFEEARIFNNSATFGGGIQVRKDSSANLNGVEISGNTLALDGGGLYVEGTVNLTNVTISGNSADNGAAIFLTSGSNSFDPFSSVANLNNVTIAGHGAAAVQTEEFGFGTATVNMTNTILAGEEPACDNTGGGTLASQGHNIGTDASCNLTATGDQPSTDPLMGPLFMNTPGLSATHAIGPDGPAVNAGDDGVCPETDQRGVFRVDHAPCDIGAYESDVLVPTESPTAATSTATATATPTDTPEPTDSATPTATPRLVEWGDNDCLNGFKPQDALMLIALFAQLETVFPTAPGCPAIGTPFNFGVWGRVTCSGDMLADAFAILWTLVEVQYERPEPDCPLVGQLVDVS